MPSPFPGMDPFLEDPDIFPGFQRAFIVYLSELLLPALKEPYLCDIRNRVWHELPDDERREPFVEIYAGRRPNRRRVTTIELLTLTTKTPGEEGRDLYLQKRRNLMESEINLVEIDLLRGGVYADPLPMELLQRQSGAHDYRAVVWRFDKPQSLAK